jgi:hypothetical protein
MFIRKVSLDFPNEVLRHYIYEKYKNDDNKLIIQEPIVFIYNRLKKHIFLFINFSLLFSFCYLVLLYYL